MTKATCHWNMYDRDLFDLLYKLLDKKTMPDLNIHLDRRRWVSSMWRQQDYIIRMRHYDGLKLNIPKPNENDGG